VRFDGLRLLGKRRSRMLVISTSRPKVMSTAWNTACCSPIGACHTGLSAAADNTLTEGVTMGRSATEKTPQKRRSGGGIARVAAPVAAGSPPAEPAPDLPLPHERDQSAHATAAKPDKVMAQAKRDLDAGMVDTDMRATAGIDAQRRETMVPTPPARRPGKR
jgi:hypothetical protein